MSPYLATPIIAAIASVLLTPLVSRLALTMGWVDRPGVRKVHSAPVAYLGGAAVVGGLLIALAASLFIHETGGAHELASSGLLSVLAGTLVMFAVGVVDDVRGMRARHKLLAQLIASIVVVASGASISQIDLPGPTTIDFGIFAAPITVLWIVGITNAINIIDGLDSLATSISIVAAGTLVWCALSLGGGMAALIPLALAGSLIGFLPYNLYPARVFLGDAGSLAIGFCLAATTAVNANASPTSVGILLPCVALGIPLLDTCLAMTRRLLEGRSIMSADRSHLHHRLIDRGYSQPRVVAILFVLSISLSALLVLTSTFGEWPTTVAFTVSFVAYGWVFRFAGAMRIRESASAVGRVARAAQASNDEKQAIDNIALQFRGSKSVADWWRVFGTLADRLEFRSSTLILPRRSGGQFQLHWCSNTATGRPSAHDSLISIVIPVAGRRAGELLHLTLYADPRVELLSLGRRLRLMCGALAANTLKNSISDAGRSRRHNAYQQYRSASANVGRTPVP